MYYTGSLTKIRKTYSNLNNFFDYKKFVKCKYLYLLLIPGILYFIVFKYMPMYGVMIAFKDFKASKGILGSEWVGIKHFISFFNNPDCLKLIKNTLLLNVYGLIWGFPAPILFSLLLNEIRYDKFKRLTQTVSYIPHFISTVVVAGMVVNFLSPSSGIVNQLLSNLGMQKIHFMAKPEWFRTVYIASGIWQELGWSAIIYIAAITGIDPEMYEAAIMDGAGRFRRMLNITLPGIAPVIVLLLILRMGSMMEVGFEKVMLLYTPITYPTADVISTYVYRRGLISADYSYASAVGLFNSVVNLFLIAAANKISKKSGETSLW